MKQLFLLLLLVSPFLTRGQEIFNYKKLVTGNRTLSASASTINRATGEVIFGGSDSRGPSTPGLTFTWIWGDGTSTNGFFPQTKTYSDKTKNYTAKVIANYSATEKDTVDILVLFIKPTITPISLNADYAVFIPSQAMSFSSHFSSVPTKPTYYTDDRFFSGNVNRADLAYTLSVFNSIEVDMANNDVYKHNGKIQQYMLRDSTFGGAYALWFTDPLSFAVGDGLLTNLDFSSLAHELGHNITLNSPANYIIGSRVSGNATSIFAEAMAQIFQHTVGYVVLNNYAQYGFDAEYTSLMKNWFLADFGTTKTFYNQYVNGGKVFTSWNNPATPADETLFTFGTIAYKFCQYAEAQNKGYLLPAKRLMQFLQRFNPEWQRRYDQFNNNSAADSFRATMMVAALSSAFQTDLRADFRALNFPISDADWAFLSPDLLTVSESAINLPATASSTASFSVLSTAGNWSVTSSQTWLTPSVTTGSGNQLVRLITAANSAVASRTAVVTVSATGFTDRTVAITQAGVAPMLTTSTQSLSLPANGATAVSFSITANVSWSISSSQPWLTPSSASGSDSQVITLSAVANSTAAVRLATLTITAAGLPNQTATIVQAGLPPTLATSVTSLTVDAVGGSSSFDVISNTSWSVSSSVAWLIASPASTSGNAPVTLTVGANTVPDSRTATITLSATGIPVQLVTVVQHGAVITGLSTPWQEVVRIYPNPVSDQLHIDGVPPGSTILLYDSGGKLLHQQNSVSGVNKLATDSLPAGTYYLRLQSDYNTAAGRFVKVP
ncbi:BACON domain-containing protein [Fibrella forsythiae]|uniref:T9SS type A sorting domain-containing protein n=1 Tax=Fibrella forsythiae TaxID=2817061 RepID=A0ABS3JSM3_9BACT|nr:BACON domain-containing carbohydrate-binding protein [Fibrella forsythiae]MBO0953022.1 T9SS type A sorting domain-containing protein [Fibrella forsythiae]